MAENLFNVIGEFAYMASMEATCRICSKNYTDHMTLRKHFKKRHALDLGITVRNLRHDTNKPFNCSECYNGYKTECSLKAHFFDAHPTMVQTTKPIKKKSTGQGKQAQQDSSSEEEDKPVTVKEENSNEKEDDSTKNPIEDKVQEDQTPAKDKNESDTKRKLPEGYAIDDTVLKAMKIIIASMDEDLAKDFSTLQNQKENGVQ